MLVTINVDAKDANNIHSHDMPHKDDFRSVEISFSTPESTVLLAIQGTKNRVFAMLKRAILEVADDGQDLTLEQIEDEVKWMWRNS